MQTPALSSGVILLAITYHYVTAERVVAPRAIFAVTAGELAAQLESIGRSFEFVSRDDLVLAAAERRSLPERACIVTFDDGLRCQLDHGLPVLERLAVPAVFFVPTQPLAEPRPLPVHKLHYARERLDAQEVAEVLGGAGIHGHEEMDGHAQARYRYDTPATARLRYLLEVAAPADRREELIDRLFTCAGGDEASFSAELYMSRNEVAELERRHRAVGAHSHSHRPLAALAAAERAKELARSVAVLDEVTGARPLTFSYPHGTPDAVDVASARDVASAGFEIAFTTERALNRTLEEPCLLARLDANDAPGGRRPRVELVDGRARVRDGITAARTRYFDEAAVA